MTVKEARALLRSRRSSLGVSQTAVAAQAGVNPTTLNKIENTKGLPDKDVDLGTYLKIANVIGLTISPVGAEAALENVRETLAERPMQHGASSPEGRLYAGALSAEVLTHAIAAAVASSVDRIGEQIAALGDRIERAQGLAGREPVRVAPAAREPRARKHGR